MPVLRGLSLSVSRNLQFSWYWDNCRLEFSGTTDLTNKLFAELVRNMYCIWTGLPVFENNRRHCLRHRFPTDTEQSR